MGQKNSKVTGKERSLLPSCQEPAQRLPFQGTHIALSQRRPNSPPSNTSQNVPSHQKKKESGIPDENKEVNSEIPPKPSRALTPPPPYSPLEPPSSPPLSCPSPKPLFHTGMIFCLIRGFIEHSDTLRAVRTPSRPLLCSSFEPLFVPGLPTTRKPANYLGPSREIYSAESYETLSRYIIEIMAQIFSINFDRLNSAILGFEVTEGTTSILTQQERDDLICYSNLINQVNLSRKHPFPDIRQDRMLWNKFQADVIRPWTGGGFPMFKKDMVELLSMYDCFGNEISMDKQIFIGKMLDEIGDDEYLAGSKESYLKGLRVIRRSFDSYRVIITELSMNRNVESVLMDGLSDLQEAMNRVCLDTQCHYFWVSLKDTRALEVIMSEKFLH